jgi:hypothetical protein
MLLKARACSLKNKVFIQTKSFSVQRRDFEGGVFGISSTLIDAHTLPGQTEGLKPRFYKDEVFKGLVAVKPKVL